jgi:hypothetical protein
MKLVSGERCSIAKLPRTRAAIGDKAADINVAACSASACGNTVHGTLSKLK